jgi:predicted anti-sigma-YlaC factor YlaD
MSDQNRHLTDDQIQDWLDGRLTLSEGGRLDAHLEGCARCRAEVEGWRVLVEELSALPTLTPAPGFSGRVLDGIGRAERLPLAARVRATLAGWLPGKAAVEAHPDSGRLQDFLDGALRGRPAAVVRGHLAACESCRGEAQAWGAVLRGLGDLPRLAPSAAFAPAVMARVRIPQPAPARAGLVRQASDALYRAGRRVRALAGPRHRRAWAAVAGIALTPGVTVALVAYMVFSQPLMTLGNLASFLWIKGAALAGALGGGVLTSVVQSAAIFRAWTAFDTLARSPAAAGAGLLAFSMLTLASAWVLYRNLFTAPVARAHAKTA